MEYSLESLLESYCRQGLMSHYCVGWGDYSRPELTSTWIGDRSRSFDLASLTKVLCTLPLVLQSVRNNKVSLEASLGEIFRTLGREIPGELSGLSLRSIISHRSGLPAWMNFWIRVLGEAPVCVDGLSVLELIAAAFRSRPTVAATYSDLGFIVLGILLECLEQSPVDVQLGKFYGSQRGVYYPRRRKDDNFVGTGYCPIRERRLVGEVHDENCWALGGVSGHAGVFGSGLDIAHSLACQDQAGMIAQIALESQKDMKRRTGDKPTFGWFTESSSYRPELLVLKHLGFTGTAVWILPTTKLFVVLLTNRVISSRRSSWINPLRQKVFERVLEETL